MLQAGLLYMKRENGGYAGLYKWNICFMHYLVFVAESQYTNNCHSELVSESLDINKMRDPETSSGWQIAQYATETK